MLGDGFYSNQSPSIGSKQPDISSRLDFENEGYQSLNIKSRNLKSNLHIIEEKTNLHSQRIINGLKQRIRSMSVSKTIGTSRFLKRSSVNKSNYDYNDSQQLQASSFIMNSNNLSNSFVQEESRNSKVFASPTSLTGEQLLQYLLNQPHQKMIPASMRDTFIKHKKAQSQITELRQKIIQLESMMRKAYERNKKQMLNNMKLRNEKEYMKLKYAEIHDTKSGLISQINSQREINNNIGNNDNNQAKLNKLDPSNQSITHLNIPQFSTSGQRSVATLDHMYIRDQSSQLIMKPQPSSPSMRTANVYDNLVVQDMLKDLNNTKSRVKLSKNDKVQMQPFIEQLREENINLKKTVLRYQLMVREVNNQQQLKFEQKLNQNQNTVVNSQPAIDQQVKDNEGNNLEQKQNFTFQEYNGYNSQQYNSSLTSANQKSRNNQYGLSQSPSKILDNTPYKSSGIKTDRRSNMNLSVSGYKTKEVLPQLDVTQFEQLTYQLHFLVRDQQKFFESTLLFIEICKQTLDCENCAIFVCDQTVEQVFIQLLKKEKHHLLKKTYIAGESYTIIVQSQQETPDVYLPKTIQDFSQGVFKDNGILLGSFDSQGKILFGIQVTKPKSHQKAKNKTGKIHSRSFNQIDRLKLKFLSEFLAKKAEYQILRWKANETEKKIFKILGACDQIVKKRTHKDIILTMKRELASLFEFERCCVFLYDPLNEDLFTLASMDINDINTDNSQADAIIRFPTSLGLTGLACQQRMLISSNKIESDLRFNNDLDNVMAVYNIRNIMITEFGAVESETQKNSNPVGVLQLINKIGVDGITQFDIDMVNALRTFLGTCVDNITVVNYSVKVTLNVSQELSGVMQMLNDREEQSLNSKMNFEVFLKNMLQLHRFLELLQRTHNTQGIVKK